MINEIMPQTLHVALGDNAQYEDFVKILELKKNPMEVEV
jgi:hypothetical protein